MNEHDYQRFLSDAEGCDSETSTPGALTREQVEEAIRLLKEKLPIEYWPGLVNLSDTDKYLREELRCERE